MTMHYRVAGILVGLLGFASGATAAETFRDCPDCPRMVKVPAGTFIMGSSVAETRREGAKDEDVAEERPQHSVTISRDFGVGQYAVTRGEFAAFVREMGHDPTGCYVPAGGKWALDQNRSWRNPGYAQDDRHPVVCVSFEDAQRYVQWLSRKTGQSYRLPTEAEWEYAARAGTTTARFWGDDRQRACEFANVFDLATADALNFPKNENHMFFCRDGYMYTAPVGSFHPNAFGLYDMLGNVYQWIEDCYHGSYDGAPTNGSAWTSGECKSRVQRGGSWWFAPTRYVRSSGRGSGSPSIRISYVGFRVARTLLTR